VEVCDATGELTACDSPGGVVATGPLPRAQADKSSMAIPNIIQRIVLFII
jgi:uncharacterized membrane protein